MMIYIIIFLVIIFFIWYVFKKESLSKTSSTTNNKEFILSTQDKLLVPPIKAETTKDRQDIFNESFIRYKKKFNAKLRENQKQTEIAVEEKSAVNNVKNEAIQIVSAIETKQRNIKYLLSKLAESDK